MLNLAFEIGFDHYRFSLPLDITRFHDLYRQDIRNGFEAAKCQQATKIRPDMYERKLLSIQDRGLIKGLEVTITADNLRYEFNKTQGNCPVTDVPFTFAENNDTDWSVDRIDNDRGYCPDNIVIVSVIVNQAKSDLDLSGVIKSVLADHQSDNELLSDKEWFQMGQFYFKKMRLSKPLSFCQLLKNTQSLFDQLVFLQLFHSKEPESKKFINQLSKHVSKQSIQKAKKLATKRIYHRADIDVEVLYDSPKLYKSVQSFIQVINQHSKDFDPLLMNCLFA